MNLENKTIWITGASSGIGKALAIALSEMNVNLILSSRKREALEKVKETCNKRASVKILPLDLEQYENLATKVDEAISLFSGIDILVNNGGISQRSLIKDTVIAVDKRLMDINYFGTVALTKALLPHFIKKQSGMFVVTTSIVGKMATPMRSSYSASKHALHGFFDALRAEHYNDNVKVTLVCPGFVATNVSKNALTGDGKQQGTMDNATANGIEPERFAKLMINAIKKEKEEVYLGGLKERFGVYMKRYYPALVSRLIRKWSVT